MPSAACTVEPVPQVAQDVSVRGTLARWVADRKLAGPAAGFVVVGRGRDVHLLRDDGTDLGVVAREPEPPSADVDEPRPRRRVGAFLLEDARDLWLLSPSRDGDETQDTWTYIDLEAASPEPLRCPRGLLTKHLDGEVYPGDGRGRILVYQYGGEDYNPKYRPELEIWELSARLGCTATRVTEVLPADGLIHDNSMVGGGVVRMTEASEPDAQLQWGRRFSVWSHRHGWRPMELPDSFPPRLECWEWSAAGSVCWASRCDTAVRVEVGPKGTDIRTAELSGGRLGLLAATDGSAIIQVTVNGLTALRAEQMTPWAAQEDGPRCSTGWEVSEGSRVSGDQLGGRGVAVDYDLLGPPKPGWAHGFHVATFEGVTFELPRPPGHGRWSAFVDTDPPLIAFETEGHGNDYRVVLLDSKTLEPTRTREVFNVAELPWNAHALYREDTPGQTLPMATRALATGNVLLRYRRPRAAAGAYGLAESQDGARMWLTFRPQFEKRLVDPDPSPTYVVQDIRHDDARWRIRLADVDVDLLDATLAPIRLPPGDELDLPLLVFDELLPGQSFDGSVTLTILDADDQPVLETPKSAATGETYRLRIAAGYQGEDFSLASGEPYTLRLRYSDDRGSWVEVRHTHVTFERPAPGVAQWLVSTPHGRAVALYLLALIIFGLALASRESFPRVAAWSPPVAVMAGVFGSVGPMLVRVEPFISVWLFALLMGTTLIAVAAAGLVSLRVFRAIATAQPIKTFAPWVMKRPGRRRRWYRQYVQEARDRLKEQGAIALHGRGAQPEQYVPLPVRITAGRAEPAVELEDPALRLAEHLTAPPPDDEGTERPPGGSAVLVEAPGGLGKSALMRETVRRLLERFESTGQQIPVVCTRISADPVADVRDKLGVRHGFSQDVVAAELEAGLIVPIYDDVVNAGVPTDHFNDRVGLNQPVVLVTRPFEGLRDELQHGSRLLVAEPLALGRKHLADFIEHYQGASPSEAWLDRLQEAVEGEDGTYLPIVVRLALLHGIDDALTLDTIYRRTFTELVDPAGQANVDELLQATQAIVVRQCWRGDAAYLEYLDAEADDKPLLRELYNSGILVPRQSAGSLVEPRRVGFFHDSMRSFFIARHLARDSGDWEGVERAAREPRFRSSEIFDMTIAMARPDCIGPQLVTCMRRWFTEAAGHLGVGYIYDSLPDHIGARDWDTNVKWTEALQRALTALDTIEIVDGTWVGRADLDRGQIKQLARLFKRLARHAQRALAAG